MQGQKGSDNMPYNGHFSYTPGSDHNVPVNQLCGPIL